MHSELLVEETEDDKILDFFTFSKREYNQSFAGKDQFFWLSEKVYGSFLVVEKIDNAIEVFPIVNNKMVPVSEGYWLENFYGSHFSSINKTMRVKLTNVVNLDNTFLLKRIRGNQAMTMHYGHFLLDELTFLRCFLSLNDESLFFLGNYDNEWQKSLLSFFFPMQLSSISKCHYHTSRFDKVGQKFYKPAGIISRVTLVNAPYRILRSSIVSSSPGEEIGKYVEKFSMKYQNIFGKLCDGLMIDKKQSKILLLERQLNSKYPKRWLNAREFVTKLAFRLDIPCEIVSPERYDPVSLAIKSQKYNFVFSEPGSAIFLPLILRNNQQRFFMPHCLDTRIDDWPNMLIDFKAFKNSLSLINACPTTGDKYGDWSTQFITTDYHIDQCINLMYT